MKRKMLLLILAAMLFGISSAMAQIDTVWVSNRYCSTENIAVSPDERFVVTWGDHGWSDPSDPLPPDSLFDGWGNPAKVFNAQTGEWLKTIWDSTSEQPNHVAYVSFSPDSSKMLVGFDARGNLIIDLNNNFNVIDTVPYSGRAVYSPDMSLIAVENEAFFDANTLERVSYFDFKSKIEHNETGEPYISSQESVGIFRKNGREYVFTYRWSTQTMPFGSGGTGMAVIDLLDSTITLTPDVPYSQWYYRYGCDKYAMFDNPSDSDGDYKIYIRDIITDSIINPNLNEHTNILPQISRDNLYLVLGSSFTSIETGELLCHHFDYLSAGNRLGNEYLYTNAFPNNRIVATIPCITYLGVPPPTIQESIQSYPVPTNNKLNMNMELKGGDYTAEIVDIKGNTIKTHNLGFKQEGNDTINLDTSDLPSGTYMVIIRSENDTKTVKFIKQ